jgi:ArsR family transcriptional regulator
MLPATHDLLQQFKAMADPLRIRLLALCRQGECSVSELTGVLGLSQPRASQHLKQLCAAGLLERFRDGQRVYYRTPTRGSGAAARRQLLALIPVRDPLFAADTECLRRQRSNGLDDSAELAYPVVDRAVHRAILDLTVTAPVGDLLDIGCGRGRVLKLLASRANRAVGVDIDANARHLARAELLLAGLRNCSLRAGDMYRLPFGAAEFDTVILDDTLSAAEEPVAALREARRMLREGGRLVILASTANASAANVKRGLADWCAEAELRLAPARLVPQSDPLWLLAVALPAQSSSAAA